MSGKEVALQEKQELGGDEERTEAGRFYSPYADIVETANAIVVTMDMPGVKRSDVDISLDKNVLSIIGSIDSNKYEGLDPVYSEYNVGNFSRRFTLSTKIDSDKIAAQMADGVLSLTLPKASEAVARRIEVS